MKHLNIILVLALAVLNAYSQSDSTKRLKFISVDFHLNIYQTNQISQSDFKNISKQDNKYFEKDITNYGYYNQRGSMEIGPGAQINLGLQLFKKRPHWLSRFSLAFGNYNLLSSYYTNDTLFYLKHVTSNDTLYNSFDIVRQKSTRLSYRNEINTLGFSAAQIFSTNREKYFSVFAGVAVGGNFSVSSVIYAGESVRIQVSTIDSVTGHVTSLYQLGNLGSSDYSSEASAAKFTGIVNIGAPLGAELRFSKSRKRLKHFSLLMEFQPQYNFIIMPQISNRAYFSFRITPFHLMYRF